MKNYILKFLKDKIIVLSALVELPILLIASVPLIIYLLFRFLLQKFKIK